MVKKVTSAEDTGVKGRLRSVADFFPANKQAKASNLRVRRKNNCDAKFSRATAAALQVEEENQDPPPKKDRPVEKRPRSKAARAARRAAKGDDVSDTPAAKAARKDPPSIFIAPAKPPSTRTDWSKDSRMHDAVDEWDKIRLTANPPSRALFAKSKNIDVKTVGAYAHSDPKQRRALGSKMGKKSLVTAENAEFLVQFAIRSDRANEGRTIAQIIEQLMALQPELSMEQASNWAYRTFRTIAGDRIKKSLVVVQKTTAKCSQIHVAQQYRWMKKYEQAINFLRLKNTGTCRVTGKSFGELLPHFIIGGDETCMIADADGSLKVLGSAGRKKHEKKTSDFRGSITMYRSGNCAGNNGPTAFIMKGKKRRDGWRDDILLKNGCAEGSTIAMTENAFMTDEAWLKITDNVSAVCFGMYMLLLTIY